MKLFCFLALLASTAPAAVNPQLKQVNKVYILSMAGGMDQYLANRLTVMGVFQVVSDPQKADAILTDRIGDYFEAKLKELYPPPPPPKPQAAKKEDAKDDKTAKSDEAKKDEVKKDEAKKEEAKKDDKDSETPSGPPRISSLSRGRGNFFIVDPKSSDVLWSVYDRPKDSSPGEMDKTAERVVKRLRTDLSGKKPSAE
jgi:hypothetical protein